MTTKPVTLTSIAEEITVHLKRLENDPKINKKNKWDQTPFYCAHAYRGGAYVRVQYISYQGASSLKRQEATAYLAYLDGGGTARHFEFLRGEG